MRKIKLYIAGSLGLTKNSDYPEQLLEETLHNRLISFAYPKHLQEWLDLTGDTPGNVLIDSGAFSGWNKGQPIDLDEYIAYCHEGIENCERANKKVRAVCLDVIPGKKGETANLGRLTGSKETLQKNKDLINKAAQQGFDNMMAMKKSGITPIHVYHQGEDWSWLGKMLEHTDYIGISPANDLAVNARNRWMESVFTYLYKNGVDVKTHGFAVNSYSILKNMPWESCDAATWVLIAAYGKVFIPRGGYKNPDFTKNGYILEVSSQQNSHLNPHTVRLLEETGYDLKDIQEDHNIRKLLNARYLRTMQEYLNKYKSKKEFKPKLTLL